MPKRKAKLDEAPVVEQQSHEPLQVQSETSAPDAVGSVRPAYAKLDDPFEFKTVSTGSNKVRYGVSHAAKAYFLLFDVKPSGDGQAEAAHPVIAKLRADGWKWRATPNGVLAWKKPWSNNQYSFAEDQQMRSYASAIAKELGGPETLAR